MLKDLEEVVFPENLEEALAKLKEYGEAAALIAGGTDIVNEPPPGIKCLIDITRLGLNQIVEEEDEIRIGATATMQQVATSPVTVSLGGGLLSRSSCEGWPSPVRNAATLGGNVAGAGPFADTPAALLALDAKVVVVDESGQTLIPLEDFFVDYRTTKLGQGVLTEVRVPKTPPTARGVFLKLAPSPVDKALVNIGIYVELEGSCCTLVRVAVGAVTRTPRRIVTAEEVLHEQPLEPGVIEKAEAVITESVEPILDMRAPADYRRRMAGVLLRRALTSLRTAS